MDYIRQQKKTKIWRPVVAILLLAAVGVLAAALWFGFSLIGVRGEAVQGFTIQAGDGANEISFNLRQVGAIRSRLAFETYLYLRDIEGSLKSGAYNLPAVNIIGLVDVLLQGPPPAETWMTFIEGWTISQYADKLAESGLVDKEEFLEKAQHPAASGITTEKFPLLYSKPATVDLEGYLFPDTYRFFNQVTTNEVIDILVNTLTDKITKQMAIDVDQQGRSFHEVLTMASIIEKEVRTDRDRRLVSGLLWKRLAEGIPLQVDATVNYIIGGSKPAVSYDETKIDSPFNTYKYKGLPPGPIANPGLSAIQAAIYPTASDYYFYLSTPAGETIFSRTLEEHNAAKAQYLK